MSQTILIADDDASFRAWAARTLESEGFTVLEAEDGETAALRAMESIPAVCLIDLVLPRMLGPEVCAALRSRNPTAHIPVVFLCAAERQLKEIHAIEDPDERGDDFLRKPTSARTLVRMARKWCSRGRPAGPPPGAEKRRVPRVPTDLELSIARVVLEEDEQRELTLHEARIISISEGGVFVLTETPLPPGTRFVFTLAVPGSPRRMELAARVVYTRGGIEPGMGAAFDEISEADRHEIQLYVQLLERLVRQ